MSLPSKHDLASRSDEIDGQVEKIRRLIEGGSRIDPELAAGLATTESLSSIQKKLDQLAAGVDNLYREMGRAAAVIAGIS